MNSQHEDIIKFVRNYNKDLEVELGPNGVTHLIHIRFPIPDNNEDISSLLTVDLALRTVVLYTGSDEERELAFLLAKFFKLEVMH